MTDLDKIDIRIRKQAEPPGQRSSIDLIRHNLPGAGDSGRITELENENIRLQLLVAELLIKNQQLRKPD